MKQTESKSSFDTTPAYAAPEVLNEIESTSKVDMWGLGLILYQLLTSKHPF
jgi:serine/threonine protein kinase